MKVIWVRVKVTKVEKSYSRNVKLNSSGHKFGSTKHTAMRFACSMGLSAMANQMVWPSSLTVTGNGHT